jgi:hypothetical protein
MIKGHFTSTMFVNTHKSLFNFAEDYFTWQTKCQMGISKIILFVSIHFEPLFDHFSFVLLNLQIVLSFYSFCLNNLKVVLSV